MVTEQEPNPANESTKPMAGRARQREEQMANDFGFRKTAQGVIIPIVSTIHESTPANSVAERWLTAEGMDTNSNNNGS
jgi:hypothetical protein